MLHTRAHKSRIAIMIKQLMPECTSCVARVHSGPCSNCAQRTMQQLCTADHAAIGQENIRHNWTGEYPPQLDRRISQGPNERNVEQK